MYNKRSEGKYFVNGKIEFIGEFLNGKKWNGKGYDENGSILYEIENGSGFVREYDNEGNLIFKGDYISGKRNGKGYEFKDKFLIYEGEYLNGKRNGKGKEYSEFGDVIVEDEDIIKTAEEDQKKEKIFEGDYSNGKRWNGNGKELDNEGNILFEGEYLEGKKWNGKGIELSIEFDIFQTKTKFI